MIVMSGAVTNRLQIDPVKTAEENFFAAINGTSPNKPLLASQVTYSAPVAWDSPTDSWYNTKVVITAKAGQKLTGSVEVHYHRDVLLVLGTGFSCPPAADLAQTLSYVVQQLQLVASDVEFTVTELPTPAPGTNEVTIQLRAKASSLLYTGSLPITLVSPVEGNARLEEDGSVRLQEDGTIRLEDAA
jgi:hypothetical protein